MILASMNEIEIHSKAPFPYSLNNAPNTRYVFITNRTKIGPYSGTFKAYLSIIFASSVNEVSISIMFGAKIDLAN